MVVRVTHSKVSGKPQGSDPARVYGTHWDEDHVVEGLDIGTDVQAHDATLDALSGKALLGTGDIVLSSTLAGYQPLDSDLTAIAALSTTAYGRSLLTLANATALAAEVDSFFLTPAEGNAAYQPLDSDLTAIAALTTTSYGRAFLALADAAAARTAIGAGTIATQNSNNVTITGGSVTGITDLAIADGGTGASTAATARSNLGSTTVGDAVFIAANAAAARTAIGTGTIATQNSNAVSITGGTVSGLTSLGVSGTVTIGPTGSTTDKGIAITQTPHGTSTSSTYYPYNSIVISSDDADTDGLTGGNQAFSVTHNFGGSNMKGSRIGNYTRVNLTSPSSSSNLAKEYVGVSGYSVAASADGGTDTGSGAKGSFFGANFVAATQASITNLYGIIGGEVNIVVRTGSSTQRKVGWAIVGGAEDAVQGTTWDSALVISNQTGAVGWNDGILVGNTNGQFPITTSGNILRSTAGTVTRGIDLNATTFSSSAFRSNGFSIGPSGQINSGSAGSIVGTVSLANATSGSVTLQPVTGALGSSILSLPAKIGTLGVRQDAYKNLGSAATTAVTSIEDLMTYTIPANTLRTNQRVRIAAWGTTAANANSKTVRLHFGGTSIGGTLPTNATPWHLEGNVFVTGSSTQKYDRWGAAQGIAMSVGNGSLTETDTSTIVVKVTGQNGTASAGDITCLGFTVEIID